MSGLDFVGRVAIVSGAGGGLGEAYSKQLAVLGASVVVNDLTESAHRVADEIVAAGGSALAVTGSVTSEADTVAVADAAMERFGRIDALINNAGIGYERRFDETSLDDIRQVMEVHYFGTVNFTRAVWPHMKAAGYGRILNITSAGLFGLAGWASYSAAKAAVFSLGRAIAQEGAEHGIVVNLLAPAALTTMLTKNITDPRILESVQSALPELVAPVAAYLVHESVPFTGHSLYSGSGHVSDILLGTTAGTTLPEVTIDTVAAAIADPAMHESLTAYATTAEQAQSAAV